MRIGLGLGITSVGGGDPVDRPGLNDRKLPASDVLASLA